MWLNLLEEQTGDRMSEALAFRATSSLASPPLSRLLPTPPCRPHSSPVQFLDRWERSACSTMPLDKAEDLFAWEAVLREQVAAEGEQAERLVGAARRGRCRGSPMAQVIAGCAVQCRLRQPQLTPPSPRLYVWGEMSLPWRSAPAPQPPAQACRSPALHPLPCPALPYTQAGMLQADCSSPCLPCTAYKVV